MAQGISTPQQGARVPGWELGRQQGILRIFSSSNTITETIANNFVLIPSDAFSSPNLPNVCLWDGMKTMAFLQPSPMETHLGFSIDSLFMAFCLKSELNEDH